MTPNKDLARRSIRAVWNEGQFELIDSLFAETFVQHHTANGPDISNRDEYQMFIEALREAMPDLQTTIHTTVTDGDDVVIRFTIAGTHTQAGR